MITEDFRRRQGKRYNEQDKSDQMNLNDFFQPLNFYNAAIFVVLFLSLDSLGFWIFSKLQFPSFLRPIAWVFGLGFWIFAWFILHFWIAYTAEYVAASLGVILLCCSWFYLKNQGFLSLVQTIIKFPFPYLLLILVAKRIFFLVSMPPNAWDEIAYHYYSPAHLVMEQTWDFVGNINLFSMLPRTLELGYILTFALSKTYVLARLLHLLILITGVQSVGLFIKKELGLWSAIMYTGIIYYYTYGTLVDATTGLVDIGPAILGSVIILVVITFLQKPTRGTFYALVSLISLAIGMKYTILGFVAAAVLLLCIFLVLQYQLKILVVVQQQWSKRDLLLIPLLLFLFGGYWYLKNFFVTGNPIYPFLFPCKAGIDCATGSEFFGTWARQFNLINAPKIINELFLSRPVFFGLHLFGIVFSLYLAAKNRNSSLKLLAIFLPAVILLEILLTKSISGFVLRYYYHWVLLFPLVLVLPFAGFRFRTINWKRLSTWSLGLYFLILAVVIAPIMGWNVLAYNSDTFTKNEILIRNYAKGNATIGDWVQEKYPTMHNVVTWCSKPGEMKKLYYVDPNLLYLNDEASMHIFFVHCYPVNIKPEEIKKPTDQTLPQYLSDIKVEYFVSLGPCQPNQPNPHQDPFLKERYALNQEIICQAKMIQPHIYQFE